jgi:hypothetical protein
MLPPIHMLRESKSHQRTKPDSNPILDDVDGKPSIPIKNIRTRKQFVETTANVSH